MMECDPQENISLEITVREKSHERYVCSQVIAKSHDEAMIGNFQCILSEDLEPVSFLSNLLQDGVDLKACHIDYFMEECGSLNPNISGLQSVNLYKHSRTVPMRTPSFPFVQILGVKWDRERDRAHAVASIVFPGTPEEILVFDSACDILSYQDGDLRIMSRLIRQDKFKVVFVPVQQQKNDGECAVYAIIFAAALCLKIDPSTLVCVDSHALRCFLAAVFANICSLELVIYALSPVHQRIMTESLVAPKGWTPIPRVASNVPRWVYQELRNQLASLNVVHNAIYGYRR